MSDRVGIAVATHEIRAVLVRRGTVVWHARVALTSPASLGDATRALLAGAPRLRMRSAATVVLGPAWVQVKPLEGIPSLRDATLVTRLVRENAGAFFLRRTQPPVVVAVHRDAGGVVWGAALDGCALNELGGALERRGPRLDRAIPTVTALAAVLADCAICWTDGPTRTRLVIASGELRGMRRVLPGEQPAPPAPLPPPLTLLGGEAAVFLDAYAAALCPRRVPLTWRPERSHARAALLSRGRLVAGIASLFVCVAAALAAPGARAAQYVSGAARELADTRATQLEMAQADAELRKVSQMLARVEAFRSERGRVSRLLADISRLVPDSTAIVTLRIDSLEGSLVALGPRVTGVLAGLGGASSMVMPRIVGSVTHEVVDGAQLERATVRFRRPRRAE